MGQLAGGTGLPRRRARLRDGPRPARCRPSGRAARAVDLRAAPRGSGVRGGHQMTESVIHLHPAGKLLALVGNPNCGKTALFNRLSGSNQKVANNAGVTVERKEGRLKSAAGKTLRLLDLPGTYSLHPRSPDERVTCDVL